VSARYAASAEARSDGIKGMRAVIAVALNRSLSAAYPDHPCAVIGQPGAFEPMIKDGYRQTALALKQRRLAPFPRPSSVVDAAALQMARLLVWTMAQEARHDDPTAGATHFVAPRVVAGRGQRMPRWTRVMERTARIGDHDFFRQHQLIAQEP
jgi:spore germination cell wall hydrolase CwlJ-like protein